jgi:lipoprotein-anchoring transpeptidase ErfK/SrfK
MPGAETPLGRNYYVTARFVPRNPFFGSYALETSAYSRLTDWPGGGVVGIHGTDRPGLIGQAVSHGCIRMFNRDVDRLRTLAPLGTPIDILP